MLYWLVFCDNMTLVGVTKSMVVTHPVAVKPRSTAEMLYWPVFCDNMTLVGVKKSVVITHPVAVKPTSTARRLLPDVRNKSFDGTPLRG